MLIMDDLPQLTRDVEKCRQKHAENVGEKKAKLRKMKEKYSIETIDQVIELHKKRQKKVHKLCDEYLTEKDKFLKQYGEQLDGLKTTSD